MPEVWSGMLLVSSNLGLSTGLCTSSPSDRPIRSICPFTSSEYSFAQDILITWYLIDELPQFKTRIVIITSVNDEI